MAPWWSSDLSELRKCYKRAYQKMGVARRGLASPERVEALQSNLTSARGSIMPPLGMPRRSHGGGGLPT